MNHADAITRQTERAASAAFIAAIILGLVVGAAPFGAGWTVYEATTAIDVGRRASKTENGVLTFTMENDGQIFSPYIRNPQVVRTAIAPLGISLSPEAIAARTRVSLAGTQIHITMRSRDAAMAERVAKALGQELARYLQSLPERERIVGTILPATMVKPVSMWFPSIQRGVVTFFSVLVLAVGVRMFRAGFDRQ